MNYTMDNIYRFKQSTVRVVPGDILDSQAVVIVNSTNTQITMKGHGVSGAICNKGGESIRMDAQKRLSAKVGDVMFLTFILVVLRILSMRQDHSVA